MLPFNTRSSGLISNEFDDKVFHILGCGAIGSSAATQIARMGGKSFVLYDMDEVEMQNIGVSHYVIKDVGLTKVQALQKHILSINPKTKIISLFGEFKHFPMTLTNNDIIILGFDNMRTRLLAAKSATKSNPFMIIDGRMGAEEYQQHAFINPTLKRYKKYWYTDEQGADAPCNAKATSYCSNMAGAFIANGVRKALTGQEVSEEFYFSFPTLMLAKR